MARYAYDRRRKDIAFAISLGWEYCGITGGGHLQFQHPKMDVRLIMPATPSEGRGTKNAIAWLKRNTPREE